MPHSNNNKTTFNQCLVKVSKSQKGKNPSFLLFTQNFIEYQMRNYARDVFLFITNTNASGKYNPSTIIWSEISTMAQKHPGVWWLTTAAYLHIWNSSYIRNAKWFHPAGRKGIHMWMAFHTEIYSQTWLLSPVRSNIGAEQIKRNDRERATEREILVDSCFLHVVKMLPSELYSDNWPIVPVVIKETTAEDTGPHGRRGLSSLLQHTVHKHL